MMTAPLPMSPSGRSIPALLRAEAVQLQALKNRFRTRIDRILLGRVDRAIQAAVCPTCAESQADGVPCASPVKSCDRCANALEWVRSLRIELEQVLATKLVHTKDDWEI